MRCPTCHNVGYTYTLMEGRKTCPECKGLSRGSQHSRPSLPRTIEVRGRLVDGEDYFSSPIHPAGHYGSSNTKR